MFLQKDRTNIFPYSSKLVLKVGVFVPAAKEKTLKSWQRLKKAVIPNKGGGPPRTIAFDKIVGFQ